MDVFAFGMLEYCVLATGLVVAAVWDLRTMRIPRIVPNTLFGLWVVAQVVFGTLFGCDGFGAWVVGVCRLLVCAAVIVGGLLLVRRLLAERSSSTPLGLGDVKLLALIGLYLGFERTLEVTLIACIAALGLSWLLPRIGWRAPLHQSTGEATVERRSALKAVPFVPAIAIGVIIVGLL